MSGAKMNVTNLQAIDMLPETQVDEHELDVSDRKRTVKRFIEK